MTMNQSSDIFVLCYFLLVIVINIHNVSSIDSCYSCNGVPQERDCENIIRCGEHEKCYTKQRTTDNGNVIYESGCMGLDTCKIADLQNLGKRSITTCFKCCNGTTASGDLCNVQQCSTVNQIPNKRVRCYQCDDVDNPADCSNIVTCDLDQECYTHQIVNDVSWRRIYQLGCAAKSLCKMLNTLAHNHPTTQCYNCCNSTLCNRQLCGLAALTKPELSFKPNDRIVVVGDRITLRCEAFTSSKATMSWTFQPFGGGSGTVPSGSYSPNNGTIAFNVKQEHSGTWTCTALNQAGSTSAQATVTVIAPASLGKK